MKISRMEKNTPNEYSNDIESFTLLLPTGRPFESRTLPTCTTCPYYQQTELYANDLAMSMMSADHHVGIGI